MEGLERAESDSRKEVSTFNIKGRAESWALVCKPDEGFRQGSTHDQSNVLERLQSGDGVEDQEGQQTHPTSVAPLISHHLY